MVKKDLGFGVLISKEKVDDKTVRSIREAFKKNKKIFGKVPRKFDILFCDTEKELKKEAKYYYQPWMTATVLRDNTIVTRSPDFIEKKGRFRKKDFSSIMDHEMNHVFWNDFYNATCKPVWLLEGFAIYAGKGFIMTKKELKNMIEDYDIDYSILQYRYLERNFRKGHIPLYPIWGAFTQFLVEKYGHKRIVGLMDRYSEKLTRGHYDKLFREIFGKTEKQVFDEFLKRFK